MRKILHGQLLALLLLLAASCGKEEREAPAVFRSISVDGDEAVFDDEGRTCVEFRVDEPGYAFDYSVGGSGCAVSLALQDGSAPSDFALTLITPVAGREGAYSAAIADLGVSPGYEESVRFAMRLPQGKMVYSPPFVLVKKGPDGGAELNTGLPVVYIDVEDGKEVVSKDDYLSAVFSIRGADEADCLEEISCSVKGRGNTTWTWAKKPYLVKFDKKQSIFGMPKHKRWVLLANFMDRTLMRNLIAYKIGSMTSLDWTPHCRSVELVMNGTHLGTYLLVEQVRADSNRVPCEDGFLLESDFHYDNEIQWIQTPGKCYQFEDGIPFGVKYPDWDDGLTDAGLLEIKAYVKAVSETIYGDGFADAAEGYAKYLDISSFVDYWIVCELMVNHELANPGSVYMHKSADSRLIAGPLWDFDWGTLSYNVSPGAKSGLINRDACWYSRLFDDPAFRSAVKARWEELLPQLRTIPAYIDEMEETLRASAELNFRMWNPAEDASQNGGRIVNGDENLSFGAAVARIRKIYEERLDIISKTL